MSVYTVWTPSLPLGYTQPGKLWYVDDYTGDAPLVIELLPAGHFAGQYRINVTVTVISPAIPPGYLVVSSSWGDPTLGASSSYAQNVSLADVGPVPCDSPGGTFTSLGTLPIVATVTAFLAPLSVPPLLAIYSSVQRVA